MIELQPEPRDFRSLRHGSNRRGVSLVIGTGFTRSRDAIARGLAAIGVTPNMLTIAGFGATCAAGVCYLFGAGHVFPRQGVAPAPVSWWPLASAVCLTLAGAMDMLDGALARVGHLQSRFGEVLDSILDRCSDLAIYAGCAVHFALVGNVTYVALSILGLSNALLISYVKARAENIVDDCSVGYWLRGERVAAFVIAGYAGHVPAALWVTGLLPLFTVLRRVRHVRSLLSESGRPWEPIGTMRLLTPWRHPRGSVGYDLATGASIAILIAGPWGCPFLYGQTDPLRSILA